MDRLQAMRLFVLVADTGSFSRAAERLDLPRATATHAIQGLELRVGARLFNRTTRKVALTHEGELYLARCRKLLDELDDADAMFAGPGSRPTGVVRVDLPERMANLTLIPALPDFFARFPDIRIRLGASARLVDLVGEGVDCAIRAGALPDSSLVARRVGEMRQINCAAPAYLAKHGTPSRPEDLADHVAVGYFSSRAGRELEWEYVEAGEHKRVRMRSVLSVNSTESYTAAALAGLGLVQVPYFGVERHLAAGELVEVLHDWRPEPLPLSVVYAQGRQLSPRVRVFVEWVLGLLGGAL